MTLTFDDSAVPKPDSGADRQKRYRAAGKEAPVKRRYRHDNSKWQTDAKYLSRPFRAFDGEGVTLDDGSHIYTLFACMYDGKYHSIANANGLGTQQIFDFILKHTRTDAINVIYGGSYDFNMWLADFVKEEVWGLYNNQVFHWHGRYKLMWRRGKSFYIGTVQPGRRKSEQGVTIYDVASFFQCPFVKACDDYLGKAFYQRKRVAENKMLRSSFTMDDLAEIRKYNRAELVNLIRLMEELRSRLNKVGLRPKRWDGPGAIAAALLQRESIRDAQAWTPPAVARAARYAYAGGRFEVIKCGHVDRPAYEYDVNSAYPAALREVPNLAEGRWEHRKGEGRSAAGFTLYHVRAEAKYNYVPGPLFRRDPNGTICYPNVVTGWYWKPEIDALKKYADLGWGRYTILETWDFIPSDYSDKPFDFIDRLYTKRLALKREGDGAQVGLKLGLNSLYGKLAQQVGWKPAKGGFPAKYPPFHQLEWAGYVTSYCRAKVLTAALENLESVIAFETDALFTSEPLTEIPIGDALGEWEETEFVNLSYVQSGLYFGDTVKGEKRDVTNKTRGIDRGRLSRANVLDRLERIDATERVATVDITRFVGAGIALHQNWEEWARWKTTTKKIRLEPTGKRVHLSCQACDDSTGIALGEWHETICPFFNDAHSSEFPIEWINPNPEMDELEERRSAENYWDE